MADTTFAPDARATLPETEAWRPEWHFTPRENWINDPNGLVYFEGEYHLFFQYNPHGKDWGHMSWGHAVSRDLIHWEELPVAIPEREYMIFSGCALVDWNNTSGLGDGIKPPLLAYFTAHHPETERQTQCLAYSHDRGRTWEMYEGNPLIDLDMEHHRDPNVFWHEGSGAWVMVVAVPREHKVEFYRSTNLIDWTLASRFGPHGATGGQWECPAFIEVPDEHASGLTRWVLKVDVDLALVAGGSGAQYFVGDFDGHSFTADSDATGPIARIADHGRDFYAAISWSDLPDSHTHPVWLAWMSNHQSGKFYPTHPWRGAMTIPRELFLFEADGQWRLGQRPVPSIRDMGHEMPLDADGLKSGHWKTVAHLREGETRLFSTDVALSTSGRCELAISDEQGHSEVVVWDHGTHEISLIDKDGAVRRTPRGTVRTDDGDKLKLDILVDGSCIEVFADGGRVAFAQCWFPIGSIKLSVRKTAD